MRTGTVSPPLHSGKAPALLFKRIVKLAGGITGSLIYEHYGKEKYNAIQAHYLNWVTDAFIFSLPISPAL